MMNDLRDFDETTEETGTDASLYVEMVESLLNWNNGFLYK